ncbi:MAG: WxcM-like domain-containing protein [Nitrosopumilaceae archaeon]|nr:WxcM-like domain-containing protein [Nitrosopumilaceae archaeon]NIU01394.1 WxcM-like domain-containing protein [Nitrosopumilaceae archaeon]NIU87752.1 WxcM-like domain-containing protein [Nitrosopumilaceae archaeon]NIV66130.1 WxcM-like domain-containing protein [Nitrosopumilaceae archaeon]NIX61996.1 WxcM-like domain-containing protein [Nitrosopumilaceae archaeon]
MKSDDFDFTKLEVHETKDVKDKSVNGSLVVVWRDWDKIINEPKMVYITNVAAGKIKGPHVHKKRTSYFVCIKGKVAFVSRNSDGNYREIIASEDEPKLIQIPRNIPSAHVNLSEKESSVLVLADIAWRPNDNEMEDVLFDDYDWQKWKKPR